MSDPNLTYVPALVAVEQPRIAVAKSDGRAKLPTRKFNLDAGMDFYSLENYTLPANGYAKVRTGIIVLIPRCTFGLMKPKGSSNWLVGAGVVDEGYTGEIIFKLYNPTQEDISIKSGDPVGQLVIIPVFRAIIDEITMEDFNDYTTDRNDSGGINNA